MEPLSTSNKEAVFSFKFSRRLRNTEKTLAASVEQSTAPIKSPSIKVKCKTYRHNKAINMAVNTVPAVDRVMAFTAMDLAWAHLVPKPP